MKTRLFFLDNLRTFLIFLVVLLHSSMTYQRGFDSFWIVVDPAYSDNLALVNMYLDLFIMFTMFFISGYFIPHSIKDKSPLDFTKSKLKRIVLPWFIAVFTLIPAYKAIFLLSHGLPQEEWYSYFHLYQRAGADPYFFPNNPSQNWLWFLPVLFLFQMLYLVIKKLNLFSLNITIKTGVALSLVLGTAYGLVISGSGHVGWTHSALFDFQNERLFVYFLAFLLGSLCYKLEIFKAENRSRKQIIIGAIALLISVTVYTIVALNSFFNMVDPARNNFIFTEKLDKFAYYLSSMLSMFGFLYILLVAFRSFFNKSYRIMDYLNTYSYQVYIIHMIVMGVFALLMLPLQISGPIKFIFLTLLTFSTSNLIIYWYVRIFSNRQLLQASGLVIMVSAFFTLITIAKPDNLGYEEKTDNSARTEQPSAKVSIHEAALTGDLESIRYYISTGYDLDEKDPIGGSSPLITAAVFGKTDVALALIKAGANPNIRNNEGSTPLHTASFFCRKEIVQALLENGADKNIRNNAGSTALESVALPFEAVRGIYDYFSSTYEPLGMKLNYKQLREDRPLIAEMLRNDE